MRIVTYGPAGPAAAKASDLPELWSGESTFWVDLSSSEESELAVLQSVFRFHPLAIEDTRNQKQRPKVEEYDDHLFVILNPVAMVEGQPEFRELDVFLGRNYLVTVHAEPEPALEALERRTARRQNGQSLSASFLLYALVDTIVDTYFPVLDEIDEELSDLEDQIIDRPQREALERLLGLKRSLIEVRRVVGPQRDMFNVLTRRDIELIDHELLQYHLRDVYDHLLRITDMVDTFRDLLTSLIDLYMSAVSNRLNEVINRLTRVTVVIGAFAVITGFYGMNFAHTWPDFASPWGSSVALVVMAAAAGLLFMLFRRER